MGLPANAGLLRAAGYRYLDKGACDACGQAVEWWRTPRRREIPLLPMAGDSAPAIAHWGRCEAILKAQKKAS